MIPSIFAFIIAYLLGSINTSIIVSKLFKSSDIRTRGSGNAGATNTLRVLGKKAAILVVVGDALKGVLAVLIAKYIAHITSVSEAQYLAALGVVVGHIFPLYFGFRGGKGIMTSIAVVFCLNPLMALILFVIFVVLVFIFNYISLASVVCSVCFPVLVLIFESGNTAFLISAILMALLAVLKHSSNIKRLINGTESKFIKKHK